MDIRTKQLRAGLALLLIFFTTACEQQIYNSFSNDEFLVSSINSNNFSVENQNLAQVFSILESQCFSCHADWKQYTADQDWINAGLVQAKNLGSSSLLTRTKNYGGDMPPIGVLSSREVEVIENWILSMDL